MFDLSKVPEDVRVKVFSISEGSVDLEEESTLREFFKANKTLEDGELNVINEELRDKGFCSCNEGAGGIWLAVVVG